MDKQIICKCYGGSHMYGLNGPESDIDERGVYISLDEDYILGINVGKKSSSFVDKRNEEEDVFYFEVRRFMQSLKATNTQALELLYNKKWEYIHPFFQSLIDERESFLDTEKLFISLTGGDGKAERKYGYIGNERRLMNGERTGELGSKRKQALEKYGYSYKNAVQLLRLCEAGRIFFDQGYFPTDVSELEIFPLLKEIKFKPENFNLKEVNELVDEAFEKLCASYDTRGIIYTFDIEKANRKLMQAYSGLFHQHYIKYDSEGQD